jgi:hypothetical protein
MLGTVLKHPAQRDAWIASFSARVHCLLCEAYYFLGPMNRRLRDVKTICLVTAAATAETDFEERRA